MDTWVYLTIMKRTECLLFLYASVYLSISFDPLRCGGCAKRFPSYSPISNYISASASSQGIVAWSMRVYVPPKGSFSALLSHLTYGISNGVGDTQPSNLSLSCPSGRIRVKEATYILSLFMFSISALQKKYSN